MESTLARDTAASSKSIRLVALEHNNAGAMRLLFILPGCLSVFYAFVKVTSKSKLQSIKVVQNDSSERVDSRASFYVA